MNIKPSQKNLKGSENSAILKALKAGGHVKRVTYGNRDVLFLNGFRVFDNSKVADYSPLRGYVFNDISQCIYRTFDNHPKEVYPMVNGYSVVRDPEMLEEVVYCDINHCYLQVANKLGYINDKDYSRILKKYSEIKIEVCASFTSLFKDTKCDYFNEKGKVNRSMECDNYFLEIVRNNIINYSHGIMHKWCTGNKYLIRNIDGVWIPASEGPSLKKYLTDLGFKFKFYEGKYVNSQMIMGGDGKIIYL